MTLLFYMHWFWITTIIYANDCDAVTATVYSVTPKIIPNSSKSPMTNISANRSAKSVIKLEEIPPKGPVLSNTTVDTMALNITPAKLNKTARKKHISPGNSTRKSVTTLSPAEEETTVIDLNTTEIYSNLTENRSLINVSFNMANNTENGTSIGGDNSTQNLLHNSERIGREEEQVGSDNLSAAGITGITLGCVSIVAIVITVSFFIYRNRGFNRPQVLNDRCSNLDSSGYIDDTSVRDNSEEMYSLDNDSFLNSLEAMTIQNYWTDTVKHTKL